MGVKFVKIGKAYYVRGYLNGKRIRKRLSVYQDVAKKIYKLFCQSEAIPEVYNILPKSRNEFTAKLDNLYLIRCQDFYKIGIAFDVAKRIKSIQMCCPYPIEIIHTLQHQAAGSLEQQLHGRYKSKRLHGEWFKLNSTDVQEIVALTKVDELLDPQLKKYGGA